MKIYRLEDKNGSGPYADFELLCLKHNSNLKKWPSAPNDIINFNWDMLCGCTSLTKLREWFSREFIRAAVKRGFKITYYEIDRRYVKLSASGKQVGFYPEKAKRKKIVRIK